MGVDIGVGVSIAIGIDIFVGVSVTGDNWTMRYGHLAAAVLMVYLSSEYSMIVWVYICDAPIQTRAVHTLKT